MDVSTFLKTNNVKMAIAAIIAKYGVEIFLQLLE